MYYKNYFRLWMQKWKKMISCINDCFVTRYNNAFCGWGDWFAQVEEERIGHVYAKFFFQASFATTATTIVSGK